jgi:hypothetical protein
MGLWLLLGRWCGDVEVVLCRRGGVMVVDEYSEMYWGCCDDIVSSGVCRGGVANKQ